jgi:hypothetical protein
VRYRTARGSETHLNYMRAHAQRRLFQRHGITVTNGEFASLIAAIESGTNPSVAQARAGGTIHEVNLHGRTIYAVWSTDFRYIATFLPGMPFEVRLQRSAGAGA